MNKTIQSSAIVIARSGYSTVMDLIALGRQAIFVPTPQQPEQEFLAEFLMNNGVAFAMDQSAFELSHALNEMKGFKGMAHYHFDKRPFMAAIDYILK